MLKRSHQPFVMVKQDIIGDLRQAKMVASDETGIRIEGLNGYHWVFMSDQAIVHEAQLSRGAQVVRDVMGEHRPKIWLSDGYSAQQNHGHHQQTCLAHLARDVAYGVDASEDGLPFRLKLWLDRVFALAREVTTYAASTLERKRRALERSLAELVGTPSACPVAEALRPSVIQRKVTNGFRSMWAAQGDCAVRSVTDTAKLTGNSAWMTINQTLA